MTISSKQKFIVEYSRDEMREYLMAELKTMLGAIDEKCRCDRDECNKSALLWIETNAAAFREQWNREKHHYVQPVSTKGSST